MRSVCWRTWQPVRHAYRINLRPRPCLRPQKRLIQTSNLLWARKGSKRTIDLKDDDFKVNYFEQDSPSAEPRPVERRDRAAESEEEEIESRLREVEEGLEQDEIPTEMSMDEAREIFSESDLQKILEERDTDMPDAIFEHQISTNKVLPRHSLLHLHKLNETLDEASLNSSNEITRARMWRWYERSKLNVPGLLEIIPKPAWDLIWASQATNSPSNPSRTNRLRIIAQDKVSAGWNLSQEEQLAHLEGLFLSGEEEVALREWEKQTEDKLSELPEFLEMGLRMYSHHGSPEKAEKIMERCFQQDSTADPRLIVPVLRAYSRAGSPENVEKAWEMYQQLRDRLSSDMSMADFDNISLGFLADGHKDFALATFRDMMLCGQPAGAKSLKTYTGAMSRLGRFMSGGNSVQVNTFSLEAIKYLPRKFQNKFFYGSWLRKLISEGHINAAAQVVELMYERGVSPDARHMNGLINARFREGNNYSEGQAQGLAWAMIQERIDFAVQRRNVRVSGPPARPGSVHDHDKDIHVPTFARRPVPRATIETFCILANHYVYRGMYGHIRHLRNLLASAEIQMNSFFMNHVLFADQRNRGIESVWGRFEAASRIVKPDIQTWIFLWECMKKLVDQNRSQYVEGFPPPRYIFKRMMQWFESLHGQERTVAIEEISIHMYHDIVRCFCLASDLEGSFVAMHAVKQCFNVFPHQTTVKMLLMQVALLNPKKNKPNARIRRTLAQARKNQQAMQSEGMTEALQLMELVRQQRRQQYAETDHVEFDAAIEAEENHRVCLTFLYTVIRRRLGQKFKDDGSIHNAAEEMGVERFDVDALMDLAVAD